MTGPEHYIEAERWIDEADQRSSPEAGRECLMAAQVHATLAVAAATALQIYNPYSRTDTHTAWVEVAGGAS